MTTRPIDRTVSRNGYLLLSWLVFLALLSVRASAGSPEPHRLVYTVQPVLQSGNPHLHVEASFRSNSSTSRLMLPSEWAGQAHLYTAIRNLSVVSPGTVLADTSEPDIKTLRCRPLQTVQLTYDVVQDWQGSQVKDGLYDRPVLQPTYFYGVGEALWVYPDWPGVDPVEITLNWMGIPQGWTLTGSFGLQSRLKIQTSLERFRHATFLGGDFRVGCVEVFGNPVYIALRGHLMFPDGQFVDLVNKILRVERGFWHDARSPFFLVVLLPTDDEPGNMGGESRTNSFTLYASKTLPDVAQSRWTLAHELFHAWNPDRLGRLQNENLYWFSEGFTDYYAALLLLRAGLISLDEYVANYNDVAKAYYTSPVRRLTAAQVTQQRQCSYDAERLPYQRGFLLAHRWNAAIRARTKGRHSLDDVMLALQRRARSRGCVLSESAIADALRPYLQESAAQDIARYMDEGAILPSTEGVFGGYARIVTASFAPFDLGFDAAKSSATRIITRVAVDSNAYRAGLRDGQKWIDGGAVMDATVQAQFVVEDEKGRRTVRYYPAASEAIQVPQYQLRPDLTPHERAALLMSLGCRKTSLPAAR